MMSDSTELDRFDRALLGALQRNGRATTQELAATASLSSAPCWRRVKALEKRGVIERYVALLSRERLGLNVLAYVHVALENHHTETVAAFDRFIESAGEVQECCSVSGEHDYLLKVVVRDVAALERFLMEHLLAVPAVKSANTSIVLRQKKFTTALPVADS